MSVLFADNFDRPDGSLAGDANYSNGGDDDFAIVSHMLASLVDDASCCYVGASAASPYVQAEFAIDAGVLSAGGAYQLILSQASDNFAVRYTWTYDASGARFRYRNNVDGTNDLKSIDAPSAGTITVRLAYVQATHTLRVYYDGVLIDSVVDAKNASPFFGGVNCGSPGGITSVVLDNFEFGDLAPSISSVTPSSFADGASGIVIAGTDL
jgi:hypothetical protein